MVVLYCYGQIFSCFIFIKPLLFQTQKTYFLLWYWFVPNRMTPYLTMHENVCLCFWVFCASNLFSGFCNNSTVYNINVIKTGSVIVTFSQTNKKRIDILSEITGCHKQFLIIEISDFMDNNCSHPHLSNNHAYLICNPCLPFSQISYNSKKI